MDANTIGFLILTTILVTAMAASYFQIHMMMLVLLVAWISSWIYFKVKIDQNKRKEVKIMEEKKQTVRTYDLEDLAKKLDIKGKIVAAAMVDDEVEITFEEEEE